MKLLGLLVVASFAAAALAASDARPELAVGVPEHDHAAEEAPLAPLPPPHYKRKLQGGDPESFMWTREQLKAQVAAELASMGRSDQPALKRRLLEGGETGPDNYDATLESFKHDAREHVGEVADRAAQRGRFADTAPAGSDRRRLLGAERWGGGWRYVVDPLMWVDPNEFRYQNPATSDARFQASRFNAAGGATARRRLLQDGGHSGADAPGADALLSSAQDAAADFRGEVAARAGYSNRRMLRAAKHMPAVRGTATRR